MNDKKIFELTGINVIEKIEFEKIIFIKTLLKCIFKAIANW